MILHIAQDTMQDLLYAIKKMCNNMKYLTARLVLFCDPPKVTFENRYTYYTVRWDLIIEIVKLDNFLDKQDPAQCQIL